MRAAILTTNKPRRLGLVLTSCLLLVLIAGWLAYLPHQTIPHEEAIEYYDLDALSYEELKQQLLERGPPGPHGTMGLTEWSVSWSWACKVSVRTHIILPRHIRPEGMNARQRQNWATFLVSLRLHERIHQHHGLQAAQEIAENRCIGADHILRYWVAETHLFDLRRDHGHSEGLVLRF